MRNSSLNRLVPCDVWCRSTGVVQNESDLACVDLRGMAMKNIQEEILGNPPDLS